MMLSEKSTKNQEKVNQFRLRNINSFGNAGGSN